jgi:hypothetical protein
MLLLELLYEQQRWRARVAASGRYQAGAAPAPHELLALGLRETE